MQPITANDLRQLILASELLEGEKLERAQSLLLKQNDALPAGDSLVAAGLITPWQLKKLLEGRSKGYFLGKYKLVAQLGAGAMGSVYLAEHRVMRHRVALKVLARRLVGKPGYIQRFQQEARAAAAVNHSRLVRAFDVDSVGGLHFMVMEYVSGENLREIVQRNGPLSIENATEFTRQTAEGLDAAHRAGLIHRDVKPSNLILDENDQVRVLDLGLARIIDDEESSVTLANDTKLIGTVDFLAPEQARDCHHIDSRADIYSLGCTLYYFLCGQPPYSEGSLTQRIIQHQTVPARDIRELRPDCPDDLAAICFKMLAKKPEDRFQTCSAVAAALRDFIDGKEVELQPAHALQVKKARTSSAAAEISLAPLPEDQPAAPKRSTTTASKSSKTAVRPTRSTSSPAASKKTTFDRDLSDDTEPDQPLGGSETFVGFMDDWNAALDKANDAPNSGLSSGSGGFSSNILDHIPPTSSGPAISGASLTSSSATNNAQAESSANFGSGGLDIQAIRDRAAALVSEHDSQTGKTTPALWFCIVAGILLGLIIVGVSVSYLSSFQEKRIEGKESSENG